MLNTIKKIFGMETVDISQVIKDGAVILDVRSKGEYAGGHVKGSVNIPVNVLQGQLLKLDKNKPIITCCASGMRSATAKSILQSNGFTQVYNGGSWTNVDRFKN